MDAENKVHDVLKQCCLKHGSIPIIKKMKGFILSISAFLFLCSAFAFFSFDVFSFLTVCAAAAVRHVQAASPQAAPPIRLADIFPTSDILADDGVPARERHRVRALLEAGATKETKDVTRSE